MDLLTLRKNEEFKKRNKDTFVYIDNVGKMQKIKDDVIIIDIERFKELTEGWLVKDLKEIPNNIIEDKKYFGITENGIKFDEQTKALDLAKAQHEKELKAIAHVEMENERITRKAQQLAKELDTSLEYARDLIIKYEMEG